MLLAEVPTTLNNVPCVVLMRPSVQMLRVHTATNVAFVANVHALRDRTDVDFVREPVSKNVSLLTDLVAEKNLPVFVRSIFIQPTP